MHISQRPYSINKLDSNISESIDKLIENVKDLKIEVNKQNMELLGIKIPESISKNVKFVETKK